MAFEGLTLCLRATVSQARLWPGLAAKLQESTSHHYNQLYKNRDQCCHLANTNEKS